LTSCRYKRHKDQYKNGEEIYTKDQGGARKLKGKLKRKPRPARRKKGKKTQLQGEEKGKPSKEKLNPSTNNPFVNKSLPPQETPSLYARGLRNSVKRKMNPGESVEKKGARTLLGVTRVGGERRRNKRRRNGYSEREGGKDTTPDGKT